MDREEEFLHAFFTHVTQFCFDKAKELAEKERASCRSTQAEPWGMLLVHLPQLAVAERLYADLGFLHTKNKGFLRKDNSLKTMFESIKADFKKIEETARGANTVKAVIAEISNQLCQFIAARIQLVDFYEKIYNTSINNKVIKYHELLLTITGIMEYHSQSCSHFSLSTIKASLMLECEIFLQLLRSYVEIQNWKFIPSLMALYEAHVRILSWERILQNRETWKLGFGRTFLKANQQPALYQWLMKLKGAVLAKFSFYFHLTLCQQASSVEMRNAMSKQSIDYYHKLQSFQKKYDIFVVAFVFHLQDMQDSGSGYRHPKKEIDNTEKFTMAMSVPQCFSQKPFIHWDNIKMVLKEHCGDLKIMDKVVFSRDKNDVWIYAMCNVDPRMTFIVVYERCSKQKNKDVQITTFITDICMQMRCNNIFESLKLAK